MAASTPIPRLAYSLDELVAAGVAGRSKLYELKKAGTIKAVKIGGSTKFLASDVEKYLQSLPPATGRA